MDYTENNINKETFCPAPWIETHISVSGNVMPCCIYTENKPFGNVKKDSLSNIINGSVANNTRSELLNGIKHDGCSKCWTDEEKFGSSYRLDHLKLWEKESKLAVENTNEDYSMSPITISRLDLRFDNKCNLKCRICSPLYSTSWHADVKQLAEEFGIHMQKPSTPYSVSVSDNLFQELLNMLPNVREIFFAGGEPIIQDRHYDILQYAIDNNLSDKIQLTYNTNFSKLTYKKHNILDYWKHFQSINIGASLDDSKKRGEYHRTNMNWDKVVDNRKAINQLSNTIFSLQPTLSIFNVFHILEFLEEWIENNLLEVTKDYGLFFNMLDYPSHLDIKNLPDYYKNKVTQKYEEFIEKHSEDIRYKYLTPQLSKVLVTVKEKRTAPVAKWFKDFTFNIKSVDKVRGEDFYDIFTEYKDLSTITSTETL